MTKTLTSFIKFDIIVENMLQKSDIYLGAYQTCMMEIICKNIKQLKAVNYFRK